MFITVHARKSDESSEYKDWIINTNNIAYCNPDDYYIRQIEGPNLNVLGKEWKQFEDKLTSSGTATKGDK